MTTEKLPIPTEHQTQAVFVREVKYRYRNNDEFIPALFYAVVNGFWAAGSGKRKGALMGKYFDEGLNTGVADLHYDQPRGQYTKLVIEFKREDRRREENGGLSDQQVEFMTKIRPYAYSAVCYTTDEALAVFAWYMSLPGFGAGEVWTVEEILKGVK
jgi:hypothetical protein